MLKYRSIALVSCRGGRRVILPIRLLSTPTEALPPAPPSAIPAAVAVPTHRAQYSNILFKYAIPAVFIAGGAYIYYNAEHINAHILKYSFEVIQTEGISETIKTQLFVFLLLSLSVDKSDTYSRIAVSSGALDAILYVMEDRESSNLDLLMIAFTFGAALSAKEFAAKKMLHDEKFLDKIIEACFKTQLIEVSRLASQILLFLIKFADENEKKDLLNRNVLSYLEKASREQKDPEMQNSIMFSILNFIHDFPLDAMRNLKPQTRDLLLQCGFNIANMFLASDKQQQSIEALKDLERLFPSLPIITSAIGVAYKDLGQFDEALKFFRKAYESSPDHTETVLIYAKALVERGTLDDKREAVRALRACTSSRYSNASPEIYMLLAEILEDVKQYKQAADAVRKVVSLDPRNANARVHLAKLYLKMKQPAPAAKLLIQARDMQPYDSEAALFLGKAFYQLQKNEQAEKALQDALTLNPVVGHGEAHKMLGKIALKESRWEDASIHYENLIQIRQNDPEAYIRGSLADEKCSRPDSANLKLSRAVEIWTSKRPAFFKKHPEDLNALKQLSSRCMKGSEVPSDYVCSQISALLASVASIAEEQSKAQ